MNMSRPQLADVRVRRAIAEAVDWKRINEPSFTARPARRLRYLSRIVGGAACCRAYRYDPARRDGFSRRRLDDRVPTACCTRDRLTMRLIDLRHDRSSREYRIASADSVDAADRRHRRRGPKLSRRAISSRWTGPFTRENTTSNGRSKPTGPIPTTPEAGTAPSFRRAAPTRRG